MSAEPGSVCGIVLAAGAGVRFGGPKVLARRADGEPWVALAVGALVAGGCDRVLVVVPGGSADAAALVPPPAAVLAVPDAALGLSASLRLALAAAERQGPDAVVVLPVDTPDVVPAAIARVVSAARADGLADALVQATYDGVPGHPVVLGRHHLPALRDGLAGDRGARPYLRAHGAREIDCADLWSGRDVDVAPPPAAG